MFRVFFILTSNYLLKPWRQSSYLVGVWLGKNEINLCSKSVNKIEEISKPNNNQLLEKRFNICMLRLESIDCNVRKWVNKFQVKAYYQAQTLKAYAYCDFTAHCIMGTFFMCIDLIQQVNDFCRCLEDKQETVILPPQDTCSTFCLGRKWHFDFYNLRM